MTVKRKTLCQQKNLTAYLCKKKKPINCYDIQQQSTTTELPAPVLGQAHTKSMSVICLLNMLADIKPFP